MACTAMLAGLLYEDTLSFFDEFNHNSGLFPDDVLEVLEDLGIPCRSVNELPKRQPALVTIEWLEEGYSGHYVVWDPKRNQFLDPLHGLISKHELLRLCKIEHIWSVGRKNMRQLVKARLAKVIAEELFKPFGPVSIGLGTENGAFTIEVRFVLEPPAEVRQITEVKGIPVHIDVTGTITKKELK